MEKKKITFAVAPSAILFIALLLVGAFLLFKVSRKAPRELTIDQTAVITTRVRTLGQLTSACFYNEIVVSGAKPNLFSTTPLGSLARDGFGKDVDDHLVIIARGSVYAGIDFEKMEADGIRTVADTLYIKLPAPEYLDVIINPSDFEVFAESGRWTQEEITRLQESARQRLLKEADRENLKQKAQEGAQQAVADLLAASGYRNVRFEAPGALPFCKEGRN